MTVHELAQWIVYNIEDLCLQYMEAESSLPLELYIMNRASTAHQLRCSSFEIRELFEDQRIQTIISFYQEERDESADSLH